MTTRERVHACAHPDTFKYYLPKGEVFGVWRALVARYGEVSGPSSFGVVEVRSERLWLRAPRFMNPVTVVRLHGCTDADLKELHEILKFRVASLSAAA